MSSQRPAPDTVSGDPIVKVEGLTKRFGDEATVFEGMDLTVDRGETTVLLGPNGCGKTVLLACLAGGLTQSTGSVEVFGKPPSAVQSQLVFMLQDGLAVDELSGRENAAFYTSLHPGATDRWQAIADRLELDALDRRVGDYSGGMTRKLELALTLSVDVPLYLLDEPSSELDPTAVERFHAMLDELADADRTIVFTSHSPRDLRAADRLVFVAESGVVAEGRPDELREAVPKVVVVDGHADVAAEFLVEDRLFDTDAGRRGFLSPNADPDEAAAHSEVTSVEPANASDMFNYYVHLRGAKARR